MQKMQKMQKSPNIAQFMRRDALSVSAILSWLRLVTPCHCEHLATISLMAEFNEAVSFNQPSQEPHRTQPLLRMTRIEAPCT